MNSKPNGLTSSEWKDAIKLTANVCPVRALPELLRNSRHHKIRSILASALRGKDYQVEEEVHGLSTNGSTRRIDIITIPTRSTSGFIIDLTVRMEIDSARSILKCRLLVIPGHGKSQLQMAIIMKPAQTRTGVGGDIVESYLFASGPGRDGYLVL
ncbi:hypothetical protein ANN_02711 [Periplaneta americana]|uniref:Uncharacterized protein n=1 Tax=Periplaneta americana TaxID=6978 RepID=A0ABQ8U0I2_PERAM|nr:hypothetical protein ANN_02711 [Periplaneta americana]